MDKIAEFTIRNFKTLCMVAAFLVGVYIQHQINTAEIRELQTKQTELEVKLDRNVQRLDQMKLDKAVFNETLRQFSSMSTDIREIRSRIDEVIDRNNK